MENTDITSIDFILKKSSDNREIMECRLNDNTYELDFTSDNQDYLRSFFMAVISKLQTEKFCFKYVKDENFSNTILEEVANDYVSHLNMELESVAAGLEELYSLKIDND